LSYDEELARLKKRVDLLLYAVNKVVGTVTENWRGQIGVNEGVIKALKAILVRVAKSEASREEIRKIVSEISKGVQLQEGMIKKIEGFKVREQG